MWYCRCSRKSTMGLLINTRIDADEFCWWVWSPEWVMFQCLTDWYWFCWAPLKYHWRKTWILVLPLLYLCANSENFFFYFDIEKYCNFSISLHANYENLLFLRYSKILQSWLMSWHVLLTIHKFISHIQTHLFRPIKGFKCNGGKNISYGCIF